MFARALILILVCAASLRAQNPRDPFAEIHRRLLEAASQSFPPVSGEEGGPQAAVVQGFRAGSDNEVVTTPLLRAVSLRKGEELGSLPFTGLRRLAALHPRMAPIFQEEGVPHEFLLVGLIESGYRNDAVSAADAVGMWQFIPSTARRFGLLDESRDYRADFERSTRAAARYLRFLLNKFDDWRLALAAYNAGEQRVERAIGLGRTRDFSRLSDLRLLPEETLNYVPAVLRAIAEARNLGVIQ